VLLALAGLFAACGDDPDHLTGGGKSGGDGTTAAELQCTNKPQGRSYVLFDGTRLEESRANENVGVNRARLKPYDVLAGEYQRVLGVAPPSLGGSAGSFDVPPARWFAEAQYSGVSLTAVFDLSFEACEAYGAGKPELAAPPTTETATAQCTTLIRKAFSRSGSPDEIAACTDLAVQKLAGEANVGKRWAYVCASVLSSSQFLTF
jgi:hypothetical protein